MNKYVKTPKVISFQDVMGNDCIFAPSKYTRLEICECKNLLPLSAVCFESKEKIAFNKKSIYHYSEIGDVDNNNGTIDSNKFYGINLPSENPKSCKKDDILISTVRTYLNGIGLITKFQQNHCCSPAFLVIRNTIPTITKEYLLAILKSDFFIEQVEGFQTRGMYPRLDSNAMDKILIPIPENEHIIKYVSLLMRAILHKNDLIRKRFEEINNIIFEELNNNQCSDIFQYSLPNISELIDNGRLDTGIYSEKFKKNTHLIKNYKNGCFYIPEDQIASGCTPDVRYIDNNPELKYHWVTPTFCSDYGTIYECRINLQGKNNINENSILIINRTSKGGFGEYVGITSFYNYEDLGQGHHNQGIYRLSEGTFKLRELLFILCCMNSTLYREICACISVGSKMKEIKAFHIASIPFPKFSEEKQMDIVQLYHNDRCNYETGKFTLDNFQQKDAEYNSVAGIYELDKTAKYLKVKLNQVIDKLVNGDEIEITFDE